MRRTVLVQYLKWPDTPHWTYEMSVLGTDRHGTWLGGPAGLLARRGAEPPTTISHPFVKLIADNAWSAPLWNDEGRITVYVDIVMPARWDGDRVTMVDLDLDVIRLSDGTLYLDDEDEFIEHQEALGYPQYVIDGARTAAARVMLDVEKGAEPYGTVGPRWLAKWVAGELG